MKNQLNNNTLQIEYYDKTLKKSMLPTTSPYVLKHIKEVVELGNLSGNDKIIDVGCGMGKFTLNFMKMGFQIDGLDISEYLLDYFRQNMPSDSNTKLYFCDIVNPPSELINKYDAVVGFFTLHHINDINGFFTSVHKLLTSKGRALIVEPNPYNILYWLQITFTPGMKWSAEKGILRMRKQVIQRALGDNKIKNFKIKRYGFFPPFLYNIKLFQRITHIIEKMKIFDFFLPFQIFYFEK